MSNDYRIQGHAVVQVTVELGNLGTWDEGATVEQIDKDAKRAALNVVTDAFRGRNAKLVGEPVFKLVIGQEVR